MVRFSRGNSIDENDIEKIIANRILQITQSQPILIDEATNKQVSVSVSIGISHTDNSIQLSRNDFLTQADNALHNSKKSGKNCFRYYK